MTRFKLMIASLRAEVSFPLGLPEQYGILGSLFVEAGTVGILDEQFTNVDPDAEFEIVDDAALRAVIGASIFWESPFGPIRFDFAKDLASEEYDRTKSFQFNTRTRF